MALPIDEIFAMLDCSADEETQALGVEEGIEVKTLSVFFRPAEGRCYWENCAKIIAFADDSALSPYIALMLEWLRDMDAPGAQIIFDRLKAMPADDYSFEYSCSVRDAVRSGDSLWASALRDLGRDTGLYEQLPDDIMRDAELLLGDWYA